MKTIKWGMIGTGEVTEKKSGPALYNSRGSELIGVYNRTIEKAVSWAERHGINKVYNSVDELLMDDLDAVYIATPPNSHEEYAIKCIKAGKIPYIEKPMALDYEGCLRIIEKSEEYKVPVYVAYYRRGMEKYIKIKEILDNKMIGDIRYVEVKQAMKPLSTEIKMSEDAWRINKKVSGGGKFIDMGVHILDILDYFFGHIVEIKGIVRNLGNLYDVEDTVLANFSFENGVVGSGIWCFVAGYEEEYIKIVGDQGYIFTEGLGYGTVYVNNGNKTYEYIFEEPECVGQEYIQSIVNEMLGISKSNANIKSSANVTRVTDQLLSTYRNNVL